jgi:hypothetical protein
VRSQVVVNPDGLPQIGAFLSAKPATNAQPGDTAITIDCGGAQRNGLDIKLRQSAGRANLHTEMAKIAPAGDAIDVRLAIQIALNRTLVTDSGAPAAAQASGSEFRRRQRPWRQNSRQRTRGAQHQVGHTGTNSAAGKAKKAPTRQNGPSLGTTS